MGSLDVYRGLTKSKESKAHRFEDINLRFG